MGCGELCAYFAQGKVGERAQMMNDDARRVIYGTIVAFLVFILAWLGFVYISACSFTLTCIQANQLIERTPMPTLIPVKLLAPTKFVPPPATPTQIGGLTPEADTPAPGEPAVDIARPS